tara:strand:- start:826 stop:1182 length:357 start_codon:yes stop_codon:yes gene_type:complete
MIRINLVNEIINTSFQVGDIACYIENKETNGSGTQTQTSFTDPEGIKSIGRVVEIGSTYIVVDSSVRPPANAFIMFQKDRLANNTSLLGYYAEVKLSNNSTEKAELFALSSEITASSK